ncbi:DUF4198 domain-containing protein [Maritalea mobilis]|uniref:DUF4198 domain-containing protein n=1 Tax=Maritalea mobilis TaxID=483324 RepID=UPI001C95E452|nr:DUF4198 domain-containing protein [Maritalea mobilis]MBY6201069.1 DUF4198 domain-containing protein [Maritalea mobilis]
MKRLLTATVATLALAMPASAHFQLIFNPEANPTAPAEMPLHLIFWHPFENGHAMDMGTPEELFYVFRGERIDISDSLTPMTFTGAHNSATGFEATLPVRRNGDYTVVLVPEPYFEESEGIYIQQLTTVYFNKGGIPTDWNEPVGLPTEFVPLNRPYNVIAGSTFSAQLLSDGEPVPGAEIEVEYLAAEPDMETRTAGDPSVGPMPGGAIVAMTDENGVFTFGVPRAGFWGFAALGAGPETEHDGTDLSQDAVIWIRAYDME